MAATNEAFHWAGLVYLHQRILGKYLSHVDVRYGVRDILDALSKVKRGSRAEACALFPMFIAGGGALDQKQRPNILERIKGLERSGTAQVCFHP
jgi:hypothetical protein